MTQVKYIRLFDGDPLPKIQQLRPFKAVVVIDEKPSMDWQNDVSKWLVNQGCMYMMAWGIDCSSWDDSVDWANLENCDYGDIPDDAFVMTTWHENEPLEEVLWYAKYLATGYEIAVENSWVPLDNLIMLNIGKTDKSESLLNQYNALTET